MKQCSVGVDIEDISRFESLTIADDENFLKKIFTPAEIAYCFSKSNPAPHLAARFSGKEAVLKAMNAIHRDNPAYSDIEILNDDRGVPRITSNKKEFKNLTLQISLSHCSEKSLAFVVIFEDCP